MRKASSIHICILIGFLVNIPGPWPCAQAQDFRLPVPGAMVHRSPEFNLPTFKGIKIHPDNPFRFDFILDQGDNAIANSLSGVIARSEATKQSLKEQSTKLIKYFLTSLTIPEKDLWVNLSPYEKDRIIPQSFGLTEMGRDLLAEDYILKQITASLIYPEDKIGKKFWNRVYEEATRRYATTDIPVNTFNKVWIVPGKVVVYENAKAGTAYVVESKLKVMLEQDYLALEKNSVIQKNTVILSVAKDLKTSLVSSATPQNDVNALGSQIVREVIIPELTKEVNEGKNFAQLRQVYNSLILATWYKKKIKDSILSQVYSGKNKVAGINIDDPREKEKIYQRYLQAFKKGVYNYIKEEVDPATRHIIPRKYFSGGFGFMDMSMRVEIESTQTPVNGDISLLSDLTVDMAMMRGGKLTTVDQAIAGDVYEIKDKGEIRTIIDNWFRNAPPSGRKFSEEDWLTMLDHGKANEPILLFTGSFNKPKAIFLSLLGKESDIPVNFRLMPELQDRTRVESVLNGFGDKKILFGELMESNGENRGVLKLLWGEQARKYGQRYNFITIEGYRGDRGERGVQDWVSTMEGLGFKSIGNSDIFYRKTNALDAAMLQEEKKGGIDFNSDKMDIGIQNSGEGIKFKIDPAMLQQLQNAPGFSPVIINIQPMTNLKSWLLTSSP